MPQLFIDGMELEIDFPADDENLLGEFVRDYRNRKLEDTDRTQLPDTPLTAEQVLAYREYRQALRNIPQQEGFPSNVVWPEEP